MISFLSRLFIKDRTNYNDSTVRKKYGTLTGLTGIFLNICLFAGKFIAGIVTGAISITADAFNNLSDAGSSLLPLWVSDLLIKSLTVGIRTDMEEWNIFQVLLFP